MRSTTLVRRHDHTLLLVRILLLVLASILALSTSAQTPESDTFTGAEGPGWDLYNPTGGSKSVVNNAFRLQADPSPFPTQLGPGRVAASRSTPYTDFLITVDLVDWRTNSSATDPQAFGILARSTQPGLGQTSGYALTYSTNGAGSFNLNAVTGEQPGTGLGSVENLTLSPTSDYRMIFRGEGSRLIGELYDLANPTVRIGLIDVIDSTYASGINALFAFNQASTGPADATFDNFFAVPEPTALTLAALATIACLRRRK